jgi:hypothetical protein
MPLPPEIAAVREAGELLLRNGHEAVGARILDWVDGGCVGSRDFFRLKVNGRDWVKEVRKAQSDDLIRNAAALLGISDPDAASTKMARLCKAYYEQQWPQTCGSESCPHEAGSFEAFLWEAQRLWPRKPDALKHIRMMAILTSQQWGSASLSFAPSPSSKKLPPRQQKADQDAEADSPQ